ncbi:MAG: tRNA (N6-threonylcarbamoyladenosine(37)-N6)-methyltransferase TrmO [Candidatus Faecousia sp.]|nr:tRNA (N6-threonylcarbamoyladenosine(37)-N6)-methyltransferase TrmO [Clostridiales bacterium]MDD6296639.1 tRNA (N6-threonylcarbamoyladenosine(37)-N6)-methyltransferase TrmO [Bacillota bacterium]MDY2810438.1 tRNA (N6-threonylcarbamoyladenosine(37)-N6)-methyltransferase TrmO [Candidatus Faecousia sp.]
MQDVIIHPIAHMESDFLTKFGIPRQSGLVEELDSTIVFEPEYRNPDALRGLEGFSYIWIIWQFSKNLRKDWSPTVRPPRLGGNTRMGVFATRSSFRPNGLALSCVRLLGIAETEDRGTVLRVAGADLMNGTPIFDIKPYIPYSDAHPEALGGFTDSANAFLLEVKCQNSLLEVVPEEKRSALLGVLSHDPRPSYQHDPDRVYGLDFAGCNVKFTVRENVLQVERITKI